MRVAMGVGGEVIGTPMSPQDIVDDVVCAEADGDVRTDHIPGHRRPLPLSCRARERPERQQRTGCVMLASMVIREVTAADWAGMSSSRRADGYRAMQFNAVVETNTPAVRLWHSFGFQILATVPEAFRHPAHGYVGLHIMYRML